MLVQSAVSLNYGYSTNSLQTVFWYVDTGFYATLQNVLPMSTNIVKKKNGEQPNERGNVLLRSLFVLWMI